MTYTNLVNTFLHENSFKKNPEVFKASRFFYF